VLFHPSGLVEDSLLDRLAPWALLAKIGRTPAKVGNDLYNLYSENRTALIIELR